MAGLNFISWFDKSTVKHLRFPFSYHLMPVFLFALSQSPVVHLKESILAFLILHLIIYPSSNGYNSYQDKDEGSIGGLKHPPKVSRNLFYATLLLDFIGFLAAVFVNLWFSIFVLIYVMISRAYSYRGLRLKKYAIVGFLTVFFFQGAFTYLMCSSAFIDFSSLNFFTLPNVICMAVASLFIGSVYPLTQIYQHEADKQDGVTTISYRLGYVGTFIFSACMFTMATVLLFYYFTLKEQSIAFWLFILLMMPVVLRLGIWFFKVKRSAVNADFENTMRMNVIASSCMNIYFFILIIISIF
ncbi:MAG: 1,4-dihydroxy-2-naphthoate octaprenyltransferase [Bacteroidota bacterium]|jgi:1,4-dihydroxy-2-naphthoate octaprenyltransferase|nr:1,4-dihydroxy-2-naphthoate octaprenyltransferase [Bacteroidota bacterium]